jgi:hypothetical protein
VEPAVTTVWATSDDAPSVAARESLAKWAEARGVHLVEPSSGLPPPLAPDASIANIVEEHLEHARDAVAALDRAGADRELTAAVATLHLHPELPQASWLLAEVERARATRWRRLSPRDAAESERVWARAAALDGGRARGLGEERERGSTDAATRTVKAQLVMEGRTEGRSLLVTLDGHAVVGGALMGDEGDHRLVVREDGAIVTTAWVSLSDGATIRAPLPEETPCSRGDFARVRVDPGHGAVLAAGVQCDDWVFAREEPGGAPVTLTLTTCSGDSCGPLLTWRVGEEQPVLPEARRSHPWPAWATWTIVGASAVAVAAATLAASGVFRPTHDEPVFTTGGLHVAEIVRGP